VNGVLCHGEQYLPGPTADGCGGDDDEVGGGDSVGGGGFSLSIEARRFHTGVAFRATFGERMGSPVAEEDCSKPGSKEGSTESDA